MLCTAFHLKTLQVFSKFVFESPFYYAYQVALKRNDFVLVDFVLKDPREKDTDKKRELPPHREELEVVPKPWNKSYLSGLDLMSQHLHVTNPCMLQVLDLWHVSFG